MPLTIAFGLAALIAGAMRLLLLWASTRLSYAAGADVSVSIYRRTLYQPYAVHVARNSSEIIDGISSKTGNAIYLINMTLNLISSSVMLIAILIALLSVDPAIALAAFGGFGLIYVFVIGLTRNRLLINSQTVARESTYVIKSLQEGLGGIRDVLIDGSHATYCQIYRNADQPLRRAQGNNSFINYSPRYGMEALGMLLIAALAYSLAQQVDGIAKAIPKRQQEYRQLFDAVKVDFPDLLIMDPVPVFCNEARCTLKRGSTYLYFDDDHLNLAGAYLFSKKNIAQLY